MDDDVLSVIRDFRCDAEAQMCRHLLALNAAVLEHGGWRMRPDRRRPLTASALMSMAVRLFHEDDANFFYNVRNRLVLWLTNVGVDTPRGHRQHLVEELSMFLLRWFNDVYLHRVMVNGHWHEV